MKKTTAGRKVNNVKRRLVSALLLAAVTLTATGSVWESPVETVQAAPSMSELQNSINNHQNQLNNINSQINSLQDEQDLVQEKIDDLNAEIINTMTSIGMKEDEIIDAVNSPTAPNFRIISTSTTIPKGKSFADNLALEHFITNRSYGLCIDRNSRITIISPSSNADAGVGNFTYYLALIGGFNYISRELGPSCPYQSVFVHNPDEEPLDVDSPRLKRSIRTGIS